MDVPFPRSWWVVPGRLLGGCYPGALEPEAARAKLASLVDAGIRAVVCLQEADECDWDGVPFEPYARRLNAMAAARGEHVTCVRKPIRDMDVPTRAEMADILDTIGGFLDRDLPVYVHCFGGHGRTGTVVGCWLVRHGAEADDALRQIAGMRRHDPHLRGQPSPQTETQRRFVRTWEQAARALED